MTQSLDVDRMRAKTNQIDSVGARYLLHDNLRKRAEQYKQLTANAIQIPKKPLVEVDVDSMAWRARQRHREKRLQKEVLHDVLSTVRSSKQSIQKS
jgi:hypothetical protein